MFSMTSSAILGGSIRISLFISSDKLGGRGGVMRFGYKKAFLALVIMLAFCQPLAAQDQAVGFFTQVVGEVEILKNGKLPAMSVKEKDRVTLGDLIRTKSTSKAQIQFIDDSTLEIGPGSRVNIDQYSYDGSQRNALLKVTMGMVRTVVSRIFKKGQPDFFIHTNTAVIGIRGTDTITRPILNATEIFNVLGEVITNNINPNIGGTATLGAMNFSLVGLNQPPTVPITFSIGDLNNLMRLLNVTPGAGSLTGPGTRSFTGPSGQGTGPPGVVSGDTLMGDRGSQSLPGGVNAPVVVPPTIPAPTPAPIVTPFHGS